MNLFIPKNSVNLKDQKLSNYIVGIQGPAGSGKTTSALTFPNPVVINFDKGLNGHFGKDVIEFPIWSGEWVNAQGTKEHPNKFRPTKQGAQPNRRDCLIHILKEDCQQLTPEQTLVLDSWSALQDAFDQQQDLEPIPTKKGEENSYAYWEEKIKYSGNVMSWLHSTKANVVITYHESPTRDPKTGQLLEKIQPLMQGKFATQIKRFMPNYFRMLAEGINDKDGREIGCEYFWQVKSSEKFDAKCDRCIPDNIFKIKPTYETLAAYDKKIIV